MRNRRNQKITNVEARKINWADRVVNNFLVNQTEVIFYLVSSMCDNLSKIKFKKDRDGNFKLRHYNDCACLAFSNLGCKYDKDEIEWEADAGNWLNVIEMINTGYSKVYEIRSR